MQPRYQEHFSLLNEAEANYFADAICGALDKDITDLGEVSGKSLFTDLTNNGVDHKTACMSLANDPSPMAITILEKVIGKTPIRIVKTKPPVVTRAPRAPGAPRPKVAKNDPRIVYDVIPNPKRMGSKSYDRYNFYKEGMTVTEFLNAGGTIGDIQHDVSKGFIKLKDAE